MTERSPGLGRVGADFSGEAAPLDVAPSDADLIARVRDGGVDAMDAFGELFARHQQAAQRLARQLTRGGDADDLVSEAFAKVLQQLQRGAGPDVAFRAYLLTAVRRLHVDRIRTQHRVHVSDDMEAFDPGTPFQDTAVEEFERTTASRAFASLPERWQAVLWHLDVEQQKPAEIAPMLGLSPNSVSALAYRAREGLRQAYLQMHLTDTDEALCRWTTERLGAYVRRGLARRDSRQVQTHLHECRRCTAVYLELVEVNSNLRGLLAPLLLGGAASGYLASTSGGSAFGALSLVGRVGDLARGVGQGVTQSAVGVGAAGSAAVAAVTLTVVLGQVGPSSTPATDDAARSSSAPTSGPVASTAPHGLSPAARAAGGATSLARPSPGLTRGYLGGPERPTVGPGATPTATAVPPTPGASALPPDAAGPEGSPGATSGPDGSADGPTPDAPPARPGAQEPQSGPGSSDGGSSQDAGPPAGVSPSDSGGGTGGSGGGTGGSGGGPGGNGDAGADQQGGGAGDGGQGGGSGGSGGGGESGGSGGGSGGGGESGGSGGADQGAGAGAEQGPGKGPGNGGGNGGGNGNAGDNNGGGNDDDSSDGDDDDQGSKGGGKGHDKDKGKGHGHHDH